MAICNLKNSHDYYQYAGVKADLSSGKIISWPMSKAEDIYFAVVEYVEEGKKSSSFKWPALIGLLDLDLWYFVIKVIPDIIKAERAAFVLLKTEVNIRIIERISCKDIEECKKLASPKAKWERKI